MHIAFPAVRLGIHLCDGTVLTLTANVVPEVTSPLHRASLPDLLTLRQHLQLADTCSVTGDSATIDILIGNDYYLDIVTKESLRVGSTSLYLLSSKLGWILSGRTSSPDSAAATCAMLTMSSGVDSHQSATSDMSFHGNDPAVQELGSPSQFWQLETLGITDDLQLNDDEEAMRKFNASVSYYEGRCHVHLPWKDERPTLQTHFGLASGRLKSLLIMKHLTPSWRAEYNTIIQRQLDTGVI